MLPLIFIFEMVFTLKIFDFNFGFKFLWKLLLKLSLKIGLKENETNTFPKCWRQACSRVAREMFQVLNICCWWWQRSWKSLHSTSIVWLEVCEEATLEGDSLYAVLQPSVAFSIKRKNFIRTRRTKDPCVRVTQRDKVNKLNKFWSSSFECNSLFAKTI